MTKCGGGGGGKMGGCLGAPVRALSRACGSACDLYVRSMSGCAGRMPSGAAGAVGRGGLGRPAGASSFLQRTSSDCADDLVRAAARQRRRVAAEPDPAAVVVVDVVGKKGGAGATPPAVTKSFPARKKDAAAMGTIAEDAPCEFGPDSAGDSVSALRPPNRRGGFGAMEARRSQVFAR